MRFQFQLTEKQNFLDLNRSLIATLIRYHRQNEILPRLIALTVHSGLIFLFLFTNTDQF